MRISSVLLVTVALILVISLLCIWFYPSIQDFMASNTMWNGINNFCEEFGAENTDSLEELPPLPEQATLVAIPYLEYNDEEMSRIERFVDGGGTLLLMDDYGYGNSLLEYLGLDIRFSNQPLLDPFFCFKNQWLPRITDFAPEVKEKDISVVMLNHATTLTDTTDTSVIAWSSGESYLDANENEARDADEAIGPFPIAADLPYGQGKVAIISDPSIIISSMVDRDDNYRFISYITGQNGQQKDIIIDRSHLSQTPLDVSKTRLIGAREILSDPYALVGITAIIFAVVSGYTLRKGEKSG